MVKSILSKLIKKERAIATAISFVLGAASGAAGVSKDVVKSELCNSLFTQELLQDE